MTLAVIHGCSLKLIDAGETSSPFLCLGTYKPAIVFFIEATTVLTDVVEPMVAPEGPMVGQLSLVTMTLLVISYLIVVAVVISPI